YSGHPLACASAVASIEAFREEGIVENAAAMGEVFGEERRRPAERHPAIGEVRGLGCCRALELVTNRETREPPGPVNAAGAARARGPPRAREVLSWSRQDRGWPGRLANAFEPHAAEGRVPARVAVEHRGAYVLYAETGELRAEVAPKLRSHASGRADFPAVG